MAAKSKPPEKHAIKTVALESQAGLGWKMEIDLHEDGSGRFVHTNLCDVYGGVENEDPHVEAIERLVMAHACAGVDVETDAYAEGIDTALEALANDSE